MTSPLGFPFTKVAAPLEIFCFFEGSSDGENGDGVREAELEKPVRSDGDGEGLRSEATGTMVSYVWVWIDAGDSRMSSRIPLLS